MYHDEGDDIEAGVPIHLPGYQTGEGTFLQGTYQLSCKFLYEYDIR